MFMNVVPQVVVLSAGLFFTTLGGASLLFGPRVGRFLLGFADTPAKHYVEVAVRLLVGISFVLSRSADVRLERSPRSD